MEPWVPFVPMEPWVPFAPMEPWVSCFLLSVLSIYQLVKFDRLVQPFQLVQQYQ